MVRRLATTQAVHVHRVVAVALAAAASTLALSRTLRAQQPDTGRHALTAGDTTATHGPAFFEIRASDGEHVDAQDAPALQRRISLTLIGIPLSMAVQAIADRAGLETTFSPEIIPLGARVSMKADDVTVAAALRWVLVNAHIDVLIQNDARLTLVPQTSAAASEDSSGVLAGALVDSATGEPVPYGTVTLAGTELGRFTDRTGHFRMARLPVRGYVVRARQIGFSPVEATVAVVRDSTTRLTIRMHRVPAMLRLVRVTGHHPKECVATGIPDSAVDPMLAAVFAQIRENVDRYDLLLEKYPFRYVREEQGVMQLPRGVDSEYVDTVEYESQARRPYRVGGLIYRDSIVRQDSVFRDVFGYEHLTKARCPSQGCGFMGMRTRVTRLRRKMDLPTFADLVDPAFLAAHCFQYGGMTGGKGSPRLIRVNFQPAKRIKSPDVSGSVYLDTDSLVLRRAVFEMTKPEAAEPPVYGFTVTTTFREVLPLVPIVDSLNSEQPFQFGPPALGSDRLLGFAFEGPTPGEQPSIPSESAHVASAPRHDTAVASAAATLAVDPGITRVHAVFPTDVSCRATPAVDTISVLLYGTLHGSRPRGLSDSVWSTYTSDVLNAMSESFALPNQLSLSTFSWPFEHAVRAEAERHRVVADLNGGAARNSPVVPPIDRSTPPSGTLAIVVIDDAGDPVPFAAVHLAGISEQRRTDLTGTSSIQRLHPGAYLLEVRRIGYVPQDTTISVRAGPAVTTDTIYTGRVPERLAVVAVQGHNAGPFVSPMMSTVVSLTLNADGSLKSARVAASTVSDAVDELVVAAVRRAAAAHAFPQLADTRDHVDAISADLVVSMAEPAPGEQAVALARLDAPAWPSAGAAQLADTSQQPASHILSDLWAGGPAADTAALEFVVSDRGEALPATVRLDYSVPHPRLTDYRESYMRRLVLALRDFHFDAGRVAGCRVPEFMRESFGYRVGR